MRADRLVAVLLLMQARGRVTARQVAAELEVSVATARRDLEALSVAGVPVYPQPGKGGGWSLVGGARTDLTGLTAGEARALFLLTGSGAGAAPELRSALRKLTGALPETFRAAADSVVLDPARWGEHGAERSPAVDLLADAVTARRKVRFGYGGRERLVDPWGLVDKADTWYLIAGTDGGRRTFRVDRMSDPERTDLAAERPADFSLAGAWRETVDAMERHRSSATATVTFEERLLPVLRARFGRHFEPVSATRARITAQADHALAEQLAGWAGYVDVEGPPEVRAHLARIGRRLAEQYGRVRGMERIEVSRTIDAEPAAIFAVLRDPQGHVAIDASGMLQDATGEPASAPGDTFVVHMDREALGDRPELGKYDVTVIIRSYEEDREISWTIDGTVRPPIGHVYGYLLEPDDHGTRVTQFYDWSGIHPDWRARDIFPIISEASLKATLGILDRTVRRATR
ncbi:hypothetical protein GCM10009836_40020 [Pseudonocardia ailaonensis]|uniref:HTH deoR-type domain-containing protein n=1 Tax=Pseudonocardia ailaonensis TaxID=367279 RepID=A0ABN2N833_9PSEU